jgi:hypothetical protein
MEKCSVLSKKLTCQENERERQADSVVFVMIKTFQKCCSLLRCRVGGSLSMVQVCEFDGWPYMGRE